MNSLVSSGPARSALRCMTVAVLLMLGVLVETSRAIVITFEDLGQGPYPCIIKDVVRGYVWNGRDGSGGFTSGDAVFNNDYSFTSNAWSGWSYSNVNYTDTSKSGPAYQYAAVTGAGAGGSGNYVLGYNCSSCIENSDFGGVLPRIIVPDGRQVVSAMFTNTTYAVASMLHSDQFAHAFTSSDWFKLIITGEDALGANIGSVEFYLAQHGSMVTNWETVDLSSLAAARALEFDLTSSDIGIYGMNTPAYFAMDNLVLVPEPSAIILLIGVGIAGMFWRFVGSKKHMKRTC